MLIVTAAICGLLAMHGFEAALVPEDHTGSGDVSGIEASAAEGHIQHGSCSLEKPDGSSARPLTPCSADVFAPATPFEARGSAPEVPPLTNRALLTAFSILRL